MTPQEFVDAAKAEPYVFMHEVGTKMYDEEYEIQMRAPRAESTKVAIKSGNWTAGTTWFGGKVPVPGDKVLIPKTLRVVYNKVMAVKDPAFVKSAECITWIRVDGEFVKSTTKSVVLAVDTIVVDSLGSYKIGTDLNPIKGKFTVKIYYPGDTNLDPLTDKFLIGRGLLSLGEFLAKGPNQDHMIYPTKHPMKGDTSVTLAKTPVGWRVGHKLHLTGNELRRWEAGKYYGDHYDEDVTITSIVANVVNFTTHPDGITPQGLLYDHDGPRPADTPLNKTFIPIVNQTRNIIFSSPKDIPHCNRAHVMVHAMRTNIYGVHCDWMGRTDKELLDALPAEWQGVLYDEKGEAYADPAKPGWSFDANIGGRYPLHFHKSGELAMDHCMTHDDLVLCVCDAAIIELCLVTHTAGWGFVQHSSRLNFLRNVAIDYFGAGFVAETGNEYGDWVDNFSGQARKGLKEGAGIAEKNHIATRIGRNGSAFWFGTRNIHVYRCVAANANGAFSFGLRAGSTDPIAAYTDFPDVYVGKLYPATVHSNDVPIQGFDDNVAICCHYGLPLQKASPSQSHERRTTIRRFMSWGTENGVDLAYTARYTLIDFDVIGVYKNRAGRPMKGSAGISSGKNSSDIIIVNPRCTNFKYAISVSGSTVDEMKFQAQGAVVGGTFVDCDWPILARGQYQPNPDFYKPDGYPINEDIIRYVKPEDLADVLPTYKQDYLSWQGGNVYRTGIKTDSLGSRLRQVVGFDNFDIFRPDQVEWMLVNQGYYLSSVGKKVILAPDVIVDRVNGNVTKMFSAIVMNFTDEDRWWKNKKPVLIGPLPQEYEQFV